MADVRDTMFQTDPFSRFDQGFYAFHGVESRTIGECGWNSGWVKDCFGQATLKLISAKTIICSGVSMGTTNEVLEYLRLMSETMETTEFSSCERNGVDQGRWCFNCNFAHQSKLVWFKTFLLAGVHNVLVHTQRIPGLHVLDQSSGWVANMQSGRSKISGNNVLNKNGASVAVVHQYDRERDLQSYYFKKYIFWPIPTEEEMCSGFKIVKNSELFKKTCDLKVTSGHSPGHCCQTCNRVDRCRAFSFAGSQCFLKSCSTSSQTIPIQGVSSGYLLKA